MLPYLVNAIKLNLNKNKNDQKDKIFGKNNVIYFYKKNLQVQNTIKYNDFFIS